MIDDYAWGGDAQVLVDPSAEILADLYAQGYTQFAGGTADADWYVAHPQAGAYAQQRAAELVTGIDETSRDALRGLLTTATEEGWSERDLSAAIQDMFGSFAQWRADLIAKTETTLAYNAGNLRSYSDGGVQRVWVRDGIEFDPECQAADGAIWDLDEAENNPIEHPGCSRSFDPILPGEEVPEE